MSKIYGLFVGNEIVLTVSELPRRRSGNYDWNKIRDAVCQKFSCYDSPDCNRLIENHRMSHNGVDIFFKELPI